MPTEIIVRMNDRRELVATVVGADPRSDLALLKVTPKDLPMVKLGHSTNLKPGEWVLAIGSPFGFDYSVTAGIISAIGRSLPTENNENYVPFIQTDVAINPGNSGGPLFNLDGEVVGINSQIYTRSGGFMGVSFAIPVDVALDVVDQMKAHGKVSRGWLGVVIQEVNRDLAESFGLDKPSGALVARVIEGGPAREGRSARRRHHPASSTASTSTCRRICRISSAVRVRAAKRSLLIMRDGKRETLNVVVGELPDAGQRSGRDVAAPDGAPVPSRIGVVVEALADPLQQRAGVDHGVRVVEAQGPAAEAGHPRRRHRHALEQPGNRFTGDVREGRRCVDAGTLGTGIDRARPGADISRAARSVGMSLRQLSAVTRAPFVALHSAERGAWHAFAQMGYTRAAASTPQTATCRQSNTFETFPSSRTSTTENRPSRID